MATFIVTTFVDENDGGASIAAPGGTGLSVREAIALANANAGADTIEFAAGGTIRLTNAAGTLQVSEALTIDGDINNDGAADILITGDVSNDDTTVGATDITDIFATAATELDDNVRIFNATADITLEGLVLTGGVAKGVASDGLGGAIFAGNVTLTNSFLSGNSANDGGGIWAINANLTNSTVSGNSTGNNGGGIFAQGTTTLIDTTVSGNRAAGDGGGIYATFTANLTNSTVSGNGAGDDGGGIFAIFTANLTNSTVSSNSAGDDGGGIIGQTVNLANSTVSGNITDAGAGGGIHTSDLNLTNSIVFGNESSTGREAIVLGTFNRTGGNILGGDVFQGNTQVGATTIGDVFAATVQNGSVFAGVLADNGGPVQTIALNASAINPALDASNNSAPANDARGEARLDQPGVADVNGSAADLGAYELRSLVNAAPTAVSLAPIGASIAENTSTASPIVVGTISVSDDGQGTNTLALTGADAGFFEIVGNQLRLKAGTSLNFEAKASYQVAVTVDDTAVGSTPDATSQTFTLSVTNVNEAPTLALANTTTSLAENTPIPTARTVATIVVADDALGSEALTLSGADAALFEIAGNALRLKAGTALNFETNPVLDVTVNVNDPAINGNAIEASRTFSLSVSNVNEAPAIALANTTTSLAENTSTASARTVAAIAVTDDALGSEVLTLSGADASLFEIVGNTLRLKAGAVLDFETNARLDVTVNVNDPGINGDQMEGSAALGISITDAIEIINGTATRDTLNGSNTSEVISGLGGADTIRGNGGDDRIIGGAGPDTLTGGAGRDVFVLSAPADSPGASRGSLTPGVGGGAARHHHRFLARHRQDRPLGHRCQYEGRWRPGVRLPRCRRLQRRRGSAHLPRVRCGEDGRRQDHRLRRRQRRRPRRLPDRAHRPQGAHRGRFHSVKQRDPKKRRAPSPGPFFNSSA